MVASSLALPTSFRTASLKAPWVALKGVIISKIDSRNGPIKLVYFVMPRFKIYYR